MLYGFHCLECDHEWENYNLMYEYPDKCPECDSKELEETYELECRECDYKFVGSENDPCPECESTETYEI